jgi:putative flippase GtrA
LNILQRSIGGVSGLIYRVLGGRLPKTMISFLIVGSLGVVVHMLVLKGALFFFTSHFPVANGCAMLVAATFNYLVNNQSTFEHTSLVGRKILFGFVIYLAITSLGLLASLSISTWVFNRNHMPMLAAFCGIVAGSLWNYFMTHTFVWKLLSGDLRRR